MISRNILSIAVMLFVGILLSYQVEAQEKWPPHLPTANENGVATISHSGLLKIPETVKHILDSTSDAQLNFAKEVPKVELVYHNGLPNAALNGTGWSSWGDICVASDGKVYSGTGNHWKADKGESYIYCWDPSKNTLKKIADLNEITRATKNEVRFSKVHAHIIEGRDKKIYFTGTLDDGGKAGSKEMEGLWTKNISGGKLFQYDPVTGKTIVYADFPKARVTATIKYDEKRNMLYCALEGDRNYGKVAFGAFDMAKKEWVYQSPSGIIANDRNFMMDNQGNVYFNGPEVSDHTGIRLKAQLEAWQTNHVSLKGEEALAAALRPIPKTRLKKVADIYTTLWKYSPITNTITPTNSFFTSQGQRSSTMESNAGYIYGTTMGGELFQYAPARDELRILGSNFLANGEYITVCDLSPDGKYVYYLPGAHGSAGFSGTPIIQHDIATGQQKALGFLSESMNEDFKYAPGGTYGIKVSKDGSMLYIGLNGAPSDSLRPKGHGPGFGLTSFAIFHIPASERGG